MDYKKKLGSIDFDKVEREKDLFVILEAELTKRRECMLKNPYLYGYLPFLTILFYALSFGVYAVGLSIQFFHDIGLYHGMREFLSDIQLRIFLLVIYALFFFMFFSALKLIGETIHKSAMLFFCKNIDVRAYLEAYAGSVIYFIGAIITAVGIHSIEVMGLIFMPTTILYFIYTMYKLSQFISLPHLLGLIIFEVVAWGLFSSSILYISLRLYNGVMASLPI